jgi:hypothetical protein
MLAALLLLLVVALANLLRQQLPEWQVMAAAVAGAAVMTGSTSLQRTKTLPTMNFTAAARMNLTVNFSSLAASGTVQQALLLLLPTAAALTMQSQQQMQLRLGLLLVM